MAKLTANGYRPVRRFTTDDGERRYIVTIAPDGDQARVLRQLRIGGRWESPTQVSASKMSRGIAVSYARSLAGLYAREEAL